MISTSNSNRFYSNSRLLIGFLVVLLSGCVLLAGFGAISKTFAVRISSPRAVSANSSALSSKYDVAFGPGPARRLDEQGNRPQGMSFLPLPPRNTHAIRPTGNGDWFSLGPPGGDVSDVAASTVDANIVLAGLAPGGSFGGTLYRSSDGGNTWSEVPALDGVSVFDIEFAPAPDGITYLGTQDSVRKSTDGGLSWVTLNLGFGANDQVCDAALDPSDPSIIWAGIAEASGSQPVNVMRSTDGGATWTDRTPPHAPMSGRAIAVDPNDSNTVIAVFGGDFGGGEAWVTTDGGDSWMDRSAGLPGNPLNAVV